MQHPLLIKEPNVNDQGFISYVDDQEYLFVIYVDVRLTVFSETKQDKKEFITRARVNVN